MEKIILPVGFRFNPTDEELVKYYLLRKVKGEELPRNDVKDFDLYGDLSPWEIFQRSNITDDNQILYVFTELKRASRNRISRVAGCGTWHGDKRTIEIYDGEEEDNDVIIGLRKTFSFKNNTNNGLGSKRSQWIMHEFSLAGKYFMGKQRSDYVLCRIKKIGQSCSEAEAASAAVILQAGMEVESCAGNSIGTDNYFQAGGYADHWPQFDAEVDCFATNNNEVDMVLEELETLLQNNLNNTDHQEYWDLSTLEKCLMEDNDKQQLVVEETSRSVPDAAERHSCTGDWIPPNSYMVQETSIHDDPNYTQQNYNDQVMTLESELAISPEEDWSLFLSDESEYGHHRRQEIDEVIPMVEFENCSMHVDDDGQQEVHENEVVGFESADNEEDWTAIFEEYLNCASEQR